MTRKSSPEVRQVTKEAAIIASQLAELGDHRGALRRQPASHCQSARRPHRRRRAGAGIGHSRIGRYYIEKAPALPGSEV